MSGYEAHAEIAKRNLTFAADIPITGSNEWGYHLAVAQVHATLAQAAATRELITAIRGGTTYIKQGAL